ncbi:GNAT family N-acetyltransferase [Streptomyces sp. BI20]|uniref:GNAT family N-acetyltransferase n=1 Tax=Streptomyces sp. BI20 TaxID=3403460 RepID=UPI003C7779D6
MRNENTTPGPEGLAALRARFDREIRREAVPDSPGARIETSADGRVVRQVAAPGEGWSGVLWSDLDEAGADAAIAGELARCRELGLAEYEWKTYGHDGPADLGARLSAAGFVADTRETVLMGAVERVLDEVGEAPPPAGVTLREITSPGDVDLLARAHEAAFGRVRPALMAEVRHRLETDPEHLVVVVAMAGELPVCGARMELREGTGFAGLWGGGTHPDWRGRGIYRSLIAHRARIAAARGVEWLQVDASEDSRPILQRLGFAVLGTTTPYEWTAPTAP